jgi:Family of unknown function (DUF5985)
MSPLAEGFLLGVIATASVAIGVLFLKYWRRTRDGLFLSFGAAFLIDGFDRVWLLAQQHPHIANPAYYLVRLFSFLIILAGILSKNYGRR